MYQPAYSVTPVIASFDTHSPLPLLRLKALALSPTASVVYEIVEPAVVPENARHLNLIRRTKSKPIGLSCPPEAETPTMYAPLPQSMLTVRRPVELPTHGVSVAV